MATIHQFDKRQRGWTIGSLPMPDGTKRTYKEYGRNAFRVILEKWKSDVAEMKAALFLECREG